MTFENKIISNQEKPTKPLGPRQEHEVEIVPKDSPAAGVVQPTSPVMGKTFLYLTILKSAVCLSTIMLLLRCVSYNRGQPLKLTVRHPPGEAILLWNVDLQFNMWEYLQCGCVLTNNHNYANGPIHAIVFNADEPYTLDGLETVRRTPDFMAVYAARNPLSLAHDPVRNNDGYLYNFTMTYRRDSDLFWSDYYFTPIGGESEGRSMPEITLMEKRAKKAADELRAKIKQKQRLVFYMNYEVNDYFLEESLYLQELRKHLKLDAVLGCRGHQECGFYKFMLVFEPSACPDYVHPQVYKALAHYVVPVIVGGGNLSQLLPTDSYISSRDFASPQRLAEHLELVNQQPQLYEQYFKWHSQFRIFKNKHPYCALCWQIRQPQKRREPDEFLSWWTGYQCPNRTVAPSDTNISSQFQHNFNYRSHWSH